MCVPLPVMYGAALALSAAGTAMQVGSMIQARTANSRTLSFNAEMADRARKASVLSGAYQASEAVSQGSKVVAATRAAAAGAGADVQSEGVLAINETTRGYSATDAETIKTNALREALGYEAQATGFRFQQGLLKSQTAWGIGSALVGGAAQMVPQATGLMSSLNAGTPRYKPSVPFGTTEDLLKLYGGYGYSSSMAYPSMGR